MVIDVQGVDLSWVVIGSTMDVLRVYSILVMRGHKEKKEKFKNVHHQWR